MMRKRKEEAETTKCKGETEERKRIEEAQKKQRSTERKEEVVRLQDTVLIAWKQKML